MSKNKRTQTTEPEPELSPADKWRSLRHLSLFGAGLVDDLESRCVDRGIEIDRFNPNDAPMIRDGDLEALLGEQADTLRQELDEDSYASVESAAALLEIDSRAVEGLAIRRGVPVCYVTGRTLLHRKGVENLSALLDQEQREHDGRDIEGGKYSWGLMNRHEITALKAALPGFAWDDPFYIPKPKPRLSAFQKALNLTHGEPRPGREPTIKFDEDEELRAFADAIGIRWDQNANLRGNRAGFQLYDLCRLTSYDIETALGADRARILGTLFRDALRSAYLAVFPESEFDRESLRAALVARTKEREPVAV
jgi:hypothetical protein